MLNDLKLVSCTCYARKWRSASQCFELWIWEGI